MAVIPFLKSMPGRVLKVTIGLSLIAYGSQHASMWGLVSMMVGVVPSVTGFAGICLIEEFVTAMQTDRGQGRHPREHHA